MSKKQKRRNKPYSGADAVKPPTIHRYQAVVRSPLGEWWHDHKRAVRLITLIGGGTIIVIYLIYELLRLVFQW